MRYNVSSLLLQRQRSSYSELNLVRSGMNFDFCLLERQPCKVSLILYLKALALTIVIQYTGTLTTEGFSKQRASVFGFKREALFKFMADN